MLSRLRDAIYNPQLLSTEAFSTVPLANTLQVWCLESPRAGRLLHEALLMALDKEAQERATVRRATNGRTQ